MADDFFDDEQELIEKEEAPEKAKPSARAKAGAPAGAKAPAEAPGKPHPAGPPFWMVLAIAAIALLLGMVIGYLVGTQATLAELGNSQAAQAATGGTSTTGQLPEGHPDLNISDDGTATLADGSSSSGSSSQS